MWTRWRSEPAAKPVNLVPEVPEVLDSFPHLLVCEHCDSVYTRRALGRGEVARCQRCDAVLERAQRLTLDEWFALSVAAALLFLLANVYPIVEISLRGQSGEATLWAAVAALAASDAALFAVPAGLAFIGIPLAQIVLLLWLLGFARRGRRAPGFAFGMRWLDRLRPWSMAEVCLLGALVAITKLAGLLDVAAGLGLWALAGLTVLIIVVAGRDLRRLWQVGE
jgi:paraquat-inducible protein A